MTDNQFDEIFKERLGNYNSPVPDDMWLRINKKDKDRKVFFIPRWYMIVGIFMLIGFGGYFILDNSSNEKNIHAIKNERSTEKNDNKIKSNGKNLSIDTNDSVYIINNLKDDKVNVAKGKVKRKFHDKKLNKNNSRKNTSGITQNTDFNAVDKLNKNRGIVNDKNELAVLNENSSFTKEVFVQKKPLKDSSDQLNKDSTGADKKEAEESFIDKFFVEIYASPDLPVSNINADDKNYQQLLQDAGKVQFSYTVGAKIGIKITKKFSAKIGVQYSQINEQMKYNDSLATQTMHTNNRYKTLDIPLLASYIAKLSTTLNANINTGIILNLSSKYTGQIPDQNGNAININDSYVYLRNTGVSLYVSTDLSKKINNKIEVFAEPYFRYRLKSMANNIQPFNQKINIAGLSIGVRYKLFK